MYENVFTEVYIYIQYGGVAKQKKDMIRGKIEIILLNICPNCNRDSNTKSARRGSPLEKVWSAEAA